MNFLGIGPMELLLIVVLALIVFGPEQLPQIIAQIGKFVADAQRLTRELGDDVNRTLQTEIAQTRAAVAEPLEASRSVLNGALAPDSKRVAAAQAPEPAAASPELLEPVAAKAKPAMARPDPHGSELMPPY